MAIPVLNLGGALMGWGSGSAAPIQNPPPPPPPVSDDEFLDQIERATTGQVKDRALAAGNDTQTVSSIAATGLGLAALCIGHKRGYGNSTQIGARKLLQHSTFLPTSGPTCRRAPMDSSTTSWM